MEDPIKFTTTRYKCPHCGKSKSKKASVVEHIKICASDPANAGCRTCTHNIYTFGESDFECAMSVRPDDMRVVINCPEWAIDQSFVLQESAL